MINHKAILEELRSFMKQENLDFFVVSATDEYLNEYISLSENARYLLTGFSGSTGDALVTMKDVFLFVDGRYHLQAENETDKNHITVVKLSMDSTISGALTDKIIELSGKNQVLGFADTKISLANFNKLSDTLKANGINYREFNYDPILKFASIESKEVNIPVRYIPTSLTGTTSDEKFDIVRNQLDTDVYIISKLEEIAYITNLRGTEIPYNSTFKARAVINHNKMAVFTEYDKIPADIKARFSHKFDFKDNSEFIEYLNNLKDNLTIGFNPASTTLYTYRLVEKTGNNIVEIEKSPIAQVMSVKNSAELSHMRECFRKTDIVVSRVISWLNQNLEHGNTITEKDFSDKVKSLFIEEGAYSLSFEVIAASGKNTTFIHYTNPDSQKPIEKGDLILLDCGGYFEGGYATDMTRTFIAGGLRAKASDEQKRIYTKVLKAFLTGLNYPVNNETSGFDIDKAVREVVNKDTDEAFKFSHGTGHGVGIAVHEAPPRLGPGDVSKTKLLPGMCFSIEPGLYNDNWGGVRLENTVTLIETESGLKIETLTRSKFDKNLIDYDIMSEQELKWLEDYQKRAIG